DRRRRLAGIPRRAQAARRGGTNQQMSTAKRRRVIAGNWKMYKNQAETRAFFAALLPLVSGVKDCDIVVAPPFTNIPAAVEASKGSQIGISAQDVYWEKEGAYTGQISTGKIGRAHV